VDATANARKIIELSAYVGDLRLEAKRPATDWRVLTSSDPFVPATAP